MYLRYTKWEDWSWQLPKVSSVFKSIKKVYFAFKTTMIWYYFSILLWQLEKDLAQCKPVRDLYDSGVNLLCYYAFDSLVRFA